MKQILARPFQPEHIILCVAICLAISLSSRAEAWFLPLEEEDSWSDLTGNFIVGGYDQPSGLFTAAGSAFGVDIGPGEDPDYAFDATYEIDIFDLQESVPGDGTFSSGTIKVKLLDPGDLPAPYNAGPNLLTGDIIDVLFTGPGNLELLFEVTDGSIATPFGGLGAHGGIKLTMDGTGASKFRFNESFEFFDAEADTLGVVPEPPSLAMLGGCVALGSLVLAMRLRGRRA